MIPPVLILASAVALVGGFVVRETREE